MDFKIKSVSQMLAAAGIALVCGSNLLLPQVSPDEVRNPQLKALEKIHMPELVGLNREIAAMKFPFLFIPNRFVGLEPKDQQGADQRGLEFVRFHDRTILKMSGNYNAAFNADQLTQNQRANRVLDDVVVPILAVLPKFFPNPTDFDAFGFEISYHVRRHSQRYGFEGKENFVVIFTEGNAVAYLKAQRESQKQEILGATEVYVNGKEFGLALGERDPIMVEDVNKTGPSQVSATAEKDSASLPQKEPRSSKLAPGAHLPGPEQPLPPGLNSTRVEEAVSAIKMSSQAAATTPAASKSDVDAIQNKYQPQLDALAKEGAAKFHFVAYAPPSCVLFRDQVYLQLTLRNPAPFDKNATSLYKRAAQSFDLFLAPVLKDLLAKVPAAQEISGLDITVLDQFASNTSSSEALEYICALSSLRQFTDYTITNQDLINQSVVLVNGVRIALNLQQVE
jgi:hypothetical protein